MTPEQKAKLAKAKHKTADITLGLFDSKQIEEMHTRLNDLYEQIGKMVDKVNIKKEISDNEKQLLEVNDNLVMLISRFEQGVNVNNFDQLKEKLDKLADGVAAIPQEVTVKNQVSIPDGLATDESIKSLHRQIINVMVAFNKFIQTPPPKKGQAPEDYMPYRRVRYNGTRLVFDDTSWTSGGFSGGSSSTSSSSGGGGATTIADGADVAEGATTDAAVAAGAAGTASAKLRRLTTDTGSIKTNTDPLVASGGGGYVRQDSTATIAKESGGNLASAATSLGIMDDWDNAASNGVRVTGDVANDDPDAGEPVKIGGIAKTAIPSAVANNDRVNGYFSKTGAQIVHSALREQLSNQQTTITSSTAETTIVTADATYFLDLYGLTIANSSSTATKVTVKDATSGTTRLIAYIPANFTWGFMLPADSGHKQATANNNWTLTCGTSVASIDVTALFNKRL